MSLSENVTYTEEFLDKKQSKKEANKLYKNANKQCKEIYGYNHFKSMLSIVIKKHASNKLIAQIGYAIALLKFKNDSLHEMNKLKHCLVKKDTKEYWNTLFKETDKK